MKTIIKIIVVLFAINDSYSQVPADSLTGAYAGQYWYANPSNSPWIITPDTLYITSIDSNNCILYGHGPISYTLGGYYCTTYYSCTTCTYSLKFYDGDSIHAIYDDIAQPFPNPPYSMRFYGKRIPGTTYVGINEVKTKCDFKIYPNPCTGVIHIEGEMPDGECEVTITDMTGREVMREKLLKDGTLDVSDLDEGIYVVCVRTVDGVFNKKIVVQRK